MATLFSLVITVVFGISFIGLGAVQANDALTGSSPIMIAKGQAGDDHGKAGEDHGKAGDDHGKAGDDHGKKKAAKKKAPAKKKAAKKKAH